MGVGALRVGGVMGSYRVTRGSRDEEEDRSFEWLDGRSILDMNTRGFVSIVYICAGDCHVKGCPYIHNSQATAERYKNDNVHIISPDPWPTYALFIHSRIAELMRTRLTLPCKPNTRKKL